MTEQKPAPTPTNPAVHVPLVSQADEMTVCDDCSACRAEGDLNYIMDYHERVEPGGMVPSGECPDCGALCYPEDAKKTAREIVTVVRTGTEAAYVHGDSKAAVEAALERIPHKARSEGNAIRSGGWLVKLVVPPGEDLLQQLASPVDGGGRSR